MKRSTDRPWNAEMVTEETRVVHPRELDHRRCVWISQSLSVNTGIDMSSMERALLGIDRRAVLTCAFTMTMLGCGPDAIGVTQAPVPGAEKACKEAKDPLHPIIVEWPATSKVALDGASRRGVAVVAFDDCNLRVVTGCSAKGAYDAADTKPERHSIEMKDRNDVLAFLPLAAPKIGAGFSSGTSLVLDYVIVGERTFAGDSVELTGDCDGATHFVKGIRLGAYALTKRAHAEAAAHADIGPLTAGGSHQESDQRDKASGDVDRCESDPKDPSCGAPVELELVTISKTAPRPGSDTMMLRDR